MKFDSRGEELRYNLLRSLELAGSISGLEVHPHFTFRVNGRSIGRGWTADFRYVIDGREVAEDYKPRAWKKMPAKYRHLPKSFDLMRALYPSIELRIVTPARRGEFESEVWK